RRFFVLLPIFFAVCCPLATQGPPGQSACRNAWRRGPKKVKDANQCRTHSLVEGEKVLSLAPNHRARLPNGSSSNPIYAVSPGSLIHAARINHDMCVFAHIRRTAQFTCAPRLKGRSPLVQGCARLSPRGTIENRAQR